MSVALATMDYGLALGRHHHHHHHHLHHRMHSPGSPDRQNPEQPPETESPLRFSVVNILRPDFGRQAILNTKQPSLSTNLHSPIPLPRDLSLCSSRLSPPSPAQTPNSYQGHGSGGSRDRDSYSSHCGLASPSLPRHSGLSRSGSLESLASSRSSITGCSITGASTASTIGSESCGDSGSTNTSSSSSSSSGTTGQNATAGNNGQSLWPAWVYCTRYSDRPSSGPRTRRIKRVQSTEKNVSPEEKRPRTAFSGEQLARLKREFAENRYLTERRRQQLSRDLGLNEAQIKIWFQNKRAKIKKASGQKNPLALQLMAQGLYNHSTVPVDEDGEEIVPGRS